MAGGFLLILLVGLTVLCNTVTASKTPFRCQEAEAVKICEQLVEEVPANLPGFVRLAFHDCVGDRGCDGCLDLSNPDNNGLSVYINRLEEKYRANDLREVISRADFWVLCSNVAIKRGQEKSNQRSDASSLKLSMRFGRVDCNEANHDLNADDPYPSPHGNFNRTTEYFDSQFGLNKNETVALLGAHTLGRARPGDSGFSHAWVDNEFSFDNVFYKDIIDRSKTWILVDLDGNDNSTDHLQWSQNRSAGRPVNLMLSSDMCLAFDVNPQPNGNETRKIKDIPDSPGMELVIEYAENNAKWLADFSVAYTKMVEKTNDLQLLGAVPDGANPQCQTSNAPTTRSFRHLTTSSGAVTTPSFLAASAVIILAMTD